MGEEKDKPSTSASDTSTSASAQSDINVIKPESAQIYSDLSNTVSDDQYQNNVHGETLPKPFSITIEFIPSVHKFDDFKSTENDSVYSISNDIVALNERSRTSEHTKYNTCGNTNLYETGNVLPQEEKLSTDSLVNMDKTYTADFQEEQQDNCEMENEDIEKVNNRS